LVYLVGLVDLVHRSGKGVTRETTGRAGQAEKVSLVYLVRLACLVSFVFSLIGRKKPEQPDQLIQPE